MHITICAVGKIKEPWLRDGIREYMKRLSRYTSVQIEEVSDVPDRSPIERGMEEEGKSLLNRIQPADFVVVLSLVGKPMDSVELSRQLSGWMERGGARVTFVIGGSNGLSPEVYSRANARISLSGLTFTHGMARLILLEQLYRAYRILSGEPYHK